LINQPKKNMKKVNKYSKPKLPRAKRALSWSEILMKIQYWVEDNSTTKSVKN
jgi:hypothetical protein